MPVKIITPPAVEPVTLEEVKEHLRVDHLDLDMMIQKLIKGSREYVERTCGRALVRQTRVVSYSSWPANGVFEIPYPPVQSVTALRYTDADGSTNTVSANDYAVDLSSEPARLVLGYGKSWPAATIHHPDYPIEIEYVCGYPPVDGNPIDYRANIPESIKYAIMLGVELRFDKPPEGYAARLQDVIDMLLMPYKVWWTA